MAATVGKNKSKMVFSEAINETVNNETSAFAPRPNIPEEYPLPMMKPAAGKAGRPSNGEVKKISLSIPVDLYEGVMLGASLFHKGNKTAYINALIKKDLEMNGEKYKEFKSIMGMM